MTEPGRLGGSFRDPSGFMFERDGALYRQVNRSYKEHYDQLMASGLYADLSSQGLLVCHEEVDKAPEYPASAYKIIKPERVGFVSYPYEWCSSALRDAALLTLEIQKQALRRGMSLKDASAFNVQYRAGKPVFIDTLSFEPYCEGRPWVAYRQFCRHFLAPLALESLVDVRLGALQTGELDGVALDLAARLLGWRGRVRPGLLMHVHLHSKMEAAAPAKGRVPAPARGGFSKQALYGLLESLAAAVSKLRYEPKPSVWSGYTKTTSYAEAGAAQKRQVIGGWLDQIRPRTLFDLGANLGQFSYLASQRGIETVALDGDPACVELMYRQNGQRGETRVLPLLMDLRNPTPALGWQGRERASLFDRGPADAVLALALVHHLALGANVPLDQIAAFLARLGTHVAVEFVPKTDIQSRKLLAAREDIFPDYDEACFERALEPHFHIAGRQRLAESERTLYLLGRKA